MTVISLDNNLVVLIMSIGLVWLSIISNRLALAVISSMFASFFMLYETIQTGFVIYMFGFIVFMAFTLYFAYDMYTNREL